MKTTYTAFDGTTFDTETECADYEASATASSMFDETGEQLYFNKDGFSNAWAIYISGHGAAKTCNQWAIENCLCDEDEEIFDEFGWYIFDDYYERWIFIRPALTKVIKLY